MARCTITWRFYHRGADASQWIPEPAAEYSVTPIIGAGLWAGRCALSGDTFAVASVNMPFNVVLSEVCRA